MTISLEKKILQFLIKVYVISSLVFLFITFFTILLLGENRERTFLYAKVEIINNILQNFRDSEVKRYKDWVDYDSPTLYMSGQYPDYIEKEIRNSLDSLDDDFFVAYYPDGKFKSFFFFSEHIHLKDKIKNFFENEYHPQKINSRDEHIIDLLEIDNTYFIFFGVGLYWYGTNYMTSNGIFLFGKDLNKFIKNISKNVNINFSIISKEKKNIENIQIKNSFFSRTISAEIYLGKTKNNKEIYLLLETQKKYYIFALIIIIISFSLVTITIFLILFSIKKFLKKIINRIDQFKKEILTISENLENPSLVELMQEDKDEIYILKENFNLLIKTLQQYQEFQKNLINNLLLQKNRALKFIENILPNKYVHLFEQEYDVVLTEEYNDISILFADIVNYTKITSQLEHTEIIGILNEFYAKIDYISDYYNIEKIKTIGDCYMGACGIPNPVKNHVDKTIYFAFEILSISEEIAEQRLKNFKVRIGIHSGKAIGGILGTKKFIFDIWGEDVNIASRLESYCKPSHIHISKETFEKIQDPFLKSLFNKRGKLILKGKKQVEIYISLPYEEIKTLLKNHNVIQL